MDQIVRMHVLISQLEEEISQKTRQEWVTDLLRLSLSQNLHKS